MAHLHRIRGELEPELLIDAFHRVVAASDALRMIVVDRAGATPAVRIAEAPPARTELLDLPIEEVERWWNSRIAIPIDARSCCYDSVLLKHADDDWTWWLDLHHVVTDAFASALVFETTSAVYEALAADTAPNIPLDGLVPFADHQDALAARRHGHEAGGRGTGSRAAASVEPRGAGAPIAPYGPRGRRTTSVVRRLLPVDTHLDDALAGPYRMLSRELSLLGLLGTATAAVLHRLEGRSTVTLGVPIHHRSGPAAQNVIGPLMELYPVRVDVDGSQSFADLFARIRGAIFDVLRTAEPGESPDAPFDVVINVLTARFGDFAGLPTETRWTRSGHVEAAHALRVQAYDHGDGLCLELDINTGLSTDGTHERLPDHLGRTLAVAAADPEMTLGGFSLLSESESAELDGLNPPSPDEPPLRAVHELVAERLRRDPARVTAEHDGVAMTSAELDARSDALARWLRASGVGRDDRVGLRMRRSLGVIVAIHGVLRSGAAFVMLDPDDPPSRNEAIAADAELAMILDELPADVDAAEADLLVEHRDEIGVDLDDVAYVLYTSGTTGVPKGVPISHRGLADYLRFAVEAYPTRSPAVMPLHSSLSFDLTITSLFLPQLVGGRTIVVDGDPLTVLGAVARRRDVNIVKATPSQLEILTRLADHPLTLEVVVVGGEAFRRPVAEALAGHCAAGVRIFNEYGPTEAVVGCMVHEWDPQRDLGSDVPIGQAAPGAEVYVLDAAGQRTPPGAWGELHVRRPGMSTGYLHLPELTAARFAPVLAVDDDPLYHTGDKARVSNGAVVYGGRLDDQLKVSGVRLEPGEIESALVEHVDVTNAVVRLWTPGRRTVHRCVRCGLGSDVPDAGLDDGVCARCRDFERIEPQTRSWFRTPDDLEAIRASARQRAAGSFDCLHLLSGGKDSTYALYQLVERGWRVHAVTLDNGYISEEAKANVARTVSDLGVSHEFVTTDAMAAIFRDSLERYSNVCNGCYKTIYTLGTARAHELGIPVIVTGLSRGQFFETRLVPHQFEEDRFDPEAIDRTVLQARRAYHHTTDAVTTLLPEQAVFERDDIDVLSEIEFVDFYRYVDVELSELYDYLERRAPWVRPSDTGRSTNCLVNAAGIHVHLTERGYHNYAEPYSWDVRLGHKTRDEAVAELDDEIDLADVDRMLDEIGYRPARVELLTAWYQTRDGRAIDPVLLRAHLRERLPDRAIPAAYVHVDDLPLASSAKLDLDALPEPPRRVAGSARYDPPTTVTEALAADVWSAVLEVERVGRDDDFFDLGGASLLALETVAALERRLGIDLPDALVFEHRVLREFAAAIDASAATAGPARPIPELVDEVPLSPGEESLLFEYRADPLAPRYHVTRLYTVPEELDDDRLRVALAAIVARHQPLHTAFDARRTLLDTADALLVEPMPAGAPEAFAERQRWVPFDLERGPLVRVHVGHGTAGATHLLIGMHHACVDAGTFDAFWAEVDAAYHGRPLPQLRTSVAAHGLWQRRRLDDLAAFWELAADRSERAGTVRLPVPSDAEPDGYLERSAPVRPEQLSASSTTTPFASALAAAATVLAAHSRDGTVELRITASTKDHPDVEPLVGFFLNTLPLILEVDPSMSLLELDRLTGAQVADVLPFRAVPLARIVQRAHEQDRRPPDVRHMLAYQVLAPARWGDGEASHRIVASGAAATDLTFFVHEHPDELRLGLEYRGEVVGRADATRLLDAFAAAIEALCERPHQPIGVVADTLSEADPVGPDLPALTPVIQQFVDHAVRHPARTAVIAPDGSAMSYGELLARAEVLAGRIGAAVDAPRRVGVALERSASMVVAILAAQLAGAAYVPIDPTVPTQRIRTILEHADADLVLVADEHRGISDVAYVVDELPDGEPVRLLPTLEDDAYVIFTSGSTGVPAGVPVMHRNLAASTSARPLFYDDPPERFLLTSSIGFDSSAVGFWWPLTTGGAIVIAGEDVVHDVDRLGELIEVSAVSHLLMVPSLYRALLDRCPDKLRTLRTAIVAGEACPAGLVAAHVAALADVPLVNEYGPTEATVWATAHRCSATDDPVPIGRPVAGVRARIVGDRLQPLARGATGELLLGGPGVTRGYLGGRSNDCFVEVDGTRWYRTGDLARTDAAGRLVFVGRVDEQLNVGGVRLEPAELEGHLTDLDGIVDAVVVAAPVEGRPTLVAHVVTDRADLDAAKIKGHLAGRVAASAVPRLVEVHDALPRTPHGKIDRRRAAALPVALGSGGTRDSVDRDDPSAPLARELVDIWRRTLGDATIGPETDFFDAGGNSLLAVEIVLAVTERLGLEPPVSQLLATPTPQGMAAALAGTATADPEIVVPLTAGAPGGSTLFVIAPGGGGLYNYRDFIEAVSRRHRIVGLQFPGVDGRTAPLDTVEALGDRLFPALEAAQPDGPVNVFGFSTGGLLAYHLAGVAASRGREVGLVGVVDTYIPGWRQRVRQQRVQRVVRDRDPRAAVGLAWSTARGRFRRLRVRLADRFPVLAEEQPPWVPRGPVFAASKRAEDRYHPVPLDATVVYYSASESPDDLTVEPWSELAGELVVVPFVGRHGPHAPWEELAADVERRIDGGPAPGER